MIKLDFDRVLIRKGKFDRILEAQKCLNAAKPCYARVSASKNGFHILKFCEDGDWIEEVWDDPKRRVINLQRRKLGLTGWILFDNKAGKFAGDWIEIKDAYDIERFLDFWRA